MVAGYVTDLRRMVVFRASRTHLKHRPNATRLQALDNEKHVPRIVSPPPGIERVVAAVVVAVIC